MRGVPHDVNKLIKKARKEGWCVRRTRNNHIMWRSPDGETQHTSSGSPSSQRYMKRLRSALRRGGMVLTGK